MTKALLLVAFVLGVSRAGAEEIARADGCHV